MSERPSATDRRKPIKAETIRVVGLAVVTYESGEGYIGATCSCGWAGYHQRRKVLEDKVDKHMNKKHQGRGIRL